MLVEMAGRGKMEEGSTPGYLSIQIEMMEANFFFLRNFTDVTVYFYYMRAQPKSETGNV